MHLKVTFESVGQQDGLTKSLLGLNDKEISVSKVCNENGKFASYFTIEPSLFRQINNLVKGDEQEQYGGVSIEIVESA